MLKVPEFKFHQFNGLHFSSLQSVLFVLKNDLDISWILHFHHFCLHISYPQEIKGNIFQN